jgi:hypothetical protein
VGGLLLMITLYNTWTDIKNRANQYNSEMQYVETDDYYKIFIVNGQMMYMTELWINTDKVKGIDVTQNNIDRADFEDNYKQNAKGGYSLNKVKNIEGTKVEIVSLPKICYKCEELDVEFQEQEYDLGNIFTEFTIMVTGSEKVILKLNDNSNDEIPLLGGGNIRDIIGTDCFELKKLYYRTTGSGKASKILLWATKR